MLKGVYCGLALGLLAAMAWAKPPVPRCQPAHLRPLVWAVAEGELTAGRASNLADAGCAPRARATRRQAIAVPAAAPMSKVQAEQR